MSTSGRSRIRPALIASAAVVVLGLATLALLSDRDAHNTAQLDQALDAIPVACNPARLGLPLTAVSVDFLKRARETTWWPAPGENPEWFDAQRLSMSTPASNSVFDLGLSSSWGDYGDTFGYDFEDTDIAISLTCPVGGSDGDLSYSLSPPIGIAVGEFDLTQIDRATAADPYWAALRQTSTAAGRDYYTYSFDGNNLEKRGPSRTLGAGGQLYADNSLAIRSQSNSDTLGPLFTAEASAEELAFHEARVSAIRQLDEVQFLSARVITHSYSSALVPNYPPVASSGLQGLTHSAVGQVDGGDGPRNAFAALYSNDTAATRAAASLTYSDELLNQFGTYSVRADGGLVIIVVDESPPMANPRRLGELLGDLLIESN